MGSALSGQYGWQKEGCLEGNKERNLVCKGDGLDDIGDDKEREGNIDVGKDGSSEAIDKGI